MKLKPSLLAAYFSISALLTPSLGYGLPPTEATIAQAVANLDAYTALQKKVALQNNEMVYAEKKALLLADLLIDTDGTLNVSITNILKSYFIPAEPKQYESEIGHFLDQFDASWQSFFNTIVKPSADKESSNLILRSLFELETSDAITDRDAKVAVLSAVFAPLYQGPVGNCFAVAPLVREHEEYYRNTAKDHADILRKGYISRIVETKPTNFFFTNSLSDSDPEKSVTIDATGLLTSSKVSIFAAPAFKKAFTVMGANSTANFSQNLLKGLYQTTTPSGTLKVTVDKIIQTAASVIAQAKPTLNAGKLAIQGRYGYSSLTNNPLLKATEGAFSSMAQERPNVSIRKKVNTCVKNVLAPTFSSLGTSSAVLNFKTKFESNLNSSYRFIYDLSIPLAPGSLVGKTRAGGFLMFKRVVNQPELAGTQVVTPQDFRQLVLDVIAKTQSDLGSAAPQNVVTALTGYVLNDEFLRKVLSTYESSNASDPNPIANYQILLKTPMVNCNGASSYEVAFIDTGGPNNIVRITPRNTEELLYWCLGLAKIATHDYVPMTAPGHAFNFAPTNPDLAGFVSSGLPSDVWIRNALVIPGMKVGTSLVTESTKTAISQAVYKSISSFVNATAYNTLVAGFAGQMMTLQGYTQALNDGIVLLAGNDASRIAQIGAAVDTALFNNLSALNLAILQYSCIRFAFTNWHDGSNNVYFCAYFNPRTKKICFGRIEEDKTNLRMMDEDEWVNNQEWDAVTNPAGPAVIAAAS